MDFEAIKRAAREYEADMSRFLRAMISHPSESCGEKEVVLCIKAEMERLGFDKVEIDGLGNVIGWMGSGEKIIAIDSHIDTVGIGNIDNWEKDPYEGYETGDIIYGRGGSDQEGGMAAAVYGAKIMKDLDLIPAGLQHHGGGLRPGGGLRRHVLAVHRQQVLPLQGGGPKAHRVRHLHRAHRRRHLPRPPGPHGDPGGREGRLLPRQRPRAGGQRHLQDGGHHPGRPRPQRESPPTTPRRSRAL